MELIPLRTSATIKAGDSISRRFSEALRRSEHGLRSGDIVAIASKVVAIAERRIRTLESANPTSMAVRLARRYSLTPRFAQIVIEEADAIYGGVAGALLTVKNGEAAANAGVDQKNAPKGSVVLWPFKPDESAYRIRKSLERQSRKRIGVVIVDSRVAPMRLGTVGVALGSSGIATVADIRGKLDLYGRKTRLTVHAVADDVASAAHLMMGERIERVPFVLVRGAPLVITERARTPRLTAGECLFMSQIVSQN